ncbi:MAG: hypothetical protein ACOH2N_06175 [Devosia sp.]|jgi:hypothetical protein
MSSLTNLVRRLVARTSPVTRQRRDIDSLTLRDWADLPAHHPKSDDTSF